MLVEDEAGVFATLLYLGEICICVPRFVHHCPSKRICLTLAKVTTWGTMITSLIRILDHGSSSTCQVFPRRVLDFPDVVFKDTHYWLLSIGNRKSTKTSFGGSCYFETNHIFCLQFFLMCCSVLLFLPRGGGGSCNSDHFPPPMHSRTWS